MIRPSLDELLAGVAASLEEDVLREITAAPIRDQLRAAIRLLRKASLIWDDIGPYLFEDNRDITATLGEILILLESGRPPCDGSTLRDLCQRVRRALDIAEDRPEYPSAKTLAERNTILQELLVDVRDSLDDVLVVNPGERRVVLQKLRALYGRMLSRELVLSPSVRARRAG